MAEWVDEVDSTYTLTVGSLCATVQPYTSESFEWRIRHTGTHDTLERWTAPLPLDAAKAAAEQALREMHDALAKHFAPVLRWSEYMGSVDGLEHWALEIGQQPDDRWWWTTTLGDAAADDGGDCATAPEARRAAEAALRSLGVVFRTEDER